MMNNPWQPYQPQPYRPQQGYAPQYQQVPQMEPQYQQPGMINARYVTGREEAVAAQILPDGNIWIFADVAHGKIFTKCVNPQTNSADFREYVMISPPGQQQRQQPDPQGMQFVTAGEFEELKSDVEIIKSMMSGRREEVAG